MQQYGACEEGGTRVRKPRTQPSGAGKKVGEALVAAGSITPEQLQEALLVQREDPRELGGAAGEIGGILDGVLLRVADQLEKDLELGRKVKSAVTYPVIVLILALLAASFMLIFKVTVFAKMFEDLGGTQQFPTRAAMGLSDILTSLFGLLLCLGLGVGVFLFLRWIKTEQGQKVWGRVVLRIPAKIGDVVQKVASPGSPGRSGPQCRRRANSAGDRDNRHLLGQLGHGERALEEPERDPGGYPDLQAA